MMKISFAIAVLTTGLTCLQAEAAKLGPVISANNKDIMTNATIYPIYFDWWDPSRIEKIQKFLKDLGGSRWFVNDKRNYGLKSLTLGPKLEIQNGLPRLNQYFRRNQVVRDKNETEFSQSSMQIMDIIHRALRTNELPTNSSGIYLFFPSASVNVYSDSTYSTWIHSCAYHGSFLSEAGQGQMQSIKFAVVPDLPKCAPNMKLGTPPQGGDYGLEAIMKLAYHELVETMTNPTGGGYFVNNDWVYRNAETADLCNSDFGTACPDETGAYYNTVIRGVKYMLQTNYNPKSRTCGNFGNRVPRKGENCTTIKPEFY